MELPKPIQGNYLTRTEVFAAGGDDRDIRAAKRDGSITAIRAGAYVWIDDWRALGPVDRHRLRTRIVLDRLGPGYVATHTSAVAEHQVAMYGQDLSTVHVTHRRGGHGRRENDIVYHAGPISDSCITEIDGRLYSTPTRALWELALISSTECALVSFDSGLALRHTQRDQLEEIEGMFTYWRGARNARLALRLSDGRSGSVGESRSRYKFARHAIPAPEPQYEVHRADGYLVAVTDFGWPAYRHIGEFDGAIKYDTRSRWVEDPKREVVREKWREDAVRNELLGMSRWGWIDLDPPRLQPWLRELRVKMEQSKRLYTRNAVHIPLT